MNNNRPLQPPNPSDYNMYDEQPYGEDAYDASHGQGYSQHSRKGISPSRGAPVGSDRSQGMAYSEYEQYDTDDRRGYGREGGRSWSPRREGRGRYTDRDREGYRSPPRQRSRSRSPYYGGPPNRNVMLDGLPKEMTQEDVGRPVLKPPGLYKPLSMFFLA
ncbi:hypothetical protein HYALB_00003549 [Hymenoscyphus albidus]|uniref:Uncharacterized protein n=1 Tax=Hymenoscyphus albidus TaxID=595503 RepID=A0A9N9LX92_9HELO|nr:hypothetical protein HYALB_00003549 [Hymenoscyphus albidus]